MQNMQIQTKKQYTIFLNKKLGDGWCASVYACKKGDKQYAAKIFDMKKGKDEFIAVKTNQYRIISLARQIEILKKIGGSN